MTAEFPCQRGAMTMKEYRFGVLGAGNMGTAIADGAVRAGCFGRRRRCCSTAARKSATKTAKRAMP